MADTTANSKRAKRSDVVRSERYHKNRQIRIMARQEDMNTDFYVSRLETIDLELHEIAESVKRGILLNENGELILTKEDLEASEHQQLLPALTDNDERTVRLRISALKESATINFKLLAKTLPDAKALDSREMAKDSKLSAFAQAVSLATKDIDSD